jgi:hypothetical protein
MKELKIMVRTLLVMAATFGLVACGGADRQLGPTIEQVSIIVERHQDAQNNPAGMTYAELFDRNSRDLAELEALEAEIRAVARGADTEASRAALAYLQSAQALIRATDRRLRAELDSDGIDRFKPPSNAYALAFHAGDQRGMQRAQEREREYLNKLRESVEAIEESLANSRAAVEQVKSARDALAAHLPETRLYRKGLFETGNDEQG